MRETDQEEKYTKQRQTKTRKHKHGEQSALEPLHPPPIVLKTELLRATAGSAPGQAGKGDS